MEEIENVPEIGAATTHEQLLGGEIAILDVREQAEWDYGHIEGSHFIPLYQLQGRWGELNKQKKWVCVCLSGVRSYYAAEFLRQAGFDAANMSGGMLSWQSNGLPITDPGIVLGH